jgi:hypothetical protein
LGPPRISSRVKVAHSPSDLACGETAVIDEVVADKGYHSNQVLVDLAALDLRTYIADPLAADARGNGWPRPVPRCTPTADAFTARAGGPCSGAAASGWSARMRTLRDRWDAAHASARAREHPETALGAQRWLQSRTPDADPHRRRTPRGLQGRLAAPMALFSALWTHVSELWREDEMTLRKNPTRT